jgi:hypothetical protein
VEEEEEVEGEEVEEVEEVEGEEAASRILSRYNASISSICLSRSCGRVRRGDA